MGGDGATPTMEKYDPVENKWTIVDYLPVCGSYYSVGFKDVQHNEILNPFQIPPNH